MGMTYNIPRAATLLTAKIDFASASDNTVIAAVASNRILIHRIWFVCSIADNLTFKDGSTALSGAVPMGATGGLTFDLSGEPWFVTTVGNAFKIGSSAGAQISGIVYYSLST